MDYSKSRRGNGYSRSHIRRERLEKLWKKGIRFYFGGVTFDEDTGLYRKTIGPSRARQVIRHIANSKIRHGSETGNYAWHKRVLSIWEIW